MRILYVCLFVMFIHAAAMAATIRSEEAELTVPENWVQVDGENAVLAAQYTGAILMRMSFFAFDVKVHYTVEEYMNAFLTSTLERYPSAEVIEKGADFWILESDLDTGMNLYHLQYFYTQDTFVYLLTFAIAPEAFEASRSTCETIEKSLRLTPVKNGVLNVKTYDESDKPRTEFSSADDEREGKSDVQEKQKIDYKISYDYVFGAGRGEMPRIDSLTMRDVLGFVLGVTEGKVPVSVGDYKIEYDHVFGAGEEKLPVSVGDYKIKYSYVYGTGEERVPVSVGDYKIKYDHVSGAGEKKVPVSVGDYKIKYDYVSGAGEKKVPVRIVRD